MTGIVSSNSTDAIRAFLADKLPSHPFGFVMGDIDLDKKGPALQAWVLQSGLDPSRIIYVGDEVRDIEAARQAGVCSMAVTWGKDAENQLNSAAPDWLVRTRQEWLATVDMLL